MNKNWIDIHEDFIKYQKQWESYGLTAADAEEWISAGWKVEDCHNIFFYINLGFSGQEASEWIDAGLKKRNHLRAAYFRGCGYEPVAVSGKISGLKAEYRKWRKTLKLPSEFLDFIYPLSARERVRIFHINWGPKAELSLEVIVNGDEWKSLREIKFLGNRVNHLILQNCEQLRKINLSNCGIEGDLEMFSELVNLRELMIGGNNFTGDLASLSGLVNLERLGLSNNQLISGNLESLSQLVKLERLDLEDNPLIIGSLKFLQDLNKLKYLDISRTKVGEGLEYLSDNLKLFCCDEELFPELKDYKIDDFYYYSNWKKKWREFQFKKERTLELENKHLSFSVNEDKLKYLEMRTRELLASIKHLREEVIREFANFISLEDSIQAIIQKLISSYLKSERTAKEKTSHWESDVKNYEIIKQILINKTNLEFVISLKPILTFVGEIASKEIELEISINGRKILINNQEQTLQLIGHNQEKEALITNHYQSQIKDEEISRITYQVNNQIFIQGNIISSLLHSNIAGVNNQWGSGNCIEKYQQSLISDDYVELIGDFRTALG